MLFGRAVPVPFASASPLPLPSPSFGAEEFFFADEEVLGSVEAPDAGAGNLGVDEGLGDADVYVDEVFGPTAGETTIPLILDPTPTPIPPGLIAVGLTGVTE